MPSQENASLSEGHLARLKVRTLMLEGKLAASLRLKVQRIASKPDCSDRKLSSAPVWNRNLHDRSMRRHRCRVRSGTVDGSPGQ